MNEELETLLIFIGIILMVVIFVPMIIRYENETDRIIERNKKRRQELEEEDD